MKITALCAALAVTLALCASVLVACNNTGLSQAPRATFAQLACLDRNGDHRLNALDAADLSKVPDFDGDHRRDANDAAFLQDIDIPLDPQREAEACARSSDSAPEYLVAHGYFSPAQVSCDPGEPDFPPGKPVLLVGVGGGIVNLKNRGDAAGVRSMIDAVQRAYDDRGVKTIAVLAGPDIAGAQNIHSAMEEWMTHAVQVYLDRYPCIRVVLLGHSHGGVTADVVASRLEQQYAMRIIEVIDVDRIDALYTGDTKSRPKLVHDFNIYETNDPVLKGAPYDAPNAVNWDANDQLAPKDGDKGGPLRPVIHTTIDNSKSVREIIVADVMRRSG